MSKEIDQYTVEADRVTGEWIGDPVLVGKVEKAEWDAKIDTDDAHFDTFERVDVTCAIEVVWVD